MGSSVLGRPPWFDLRLSVTRLMEKRELIRCFDREESAAAKMVEITVDLLSPVVFLKGGCRSVDL